MLEHLENWQEACYRIPPLASKILSVHAEVATKLRSIQRIIEHAQEGYRQETMIEWAIIEHDQTFAPYFKGGFQPDRAWFQERAQEALKLNTEGVMSYVAASALIFMHPLLENTLIELLDFTQLCDINAWLSQITQKAIPISALVVGSIEKAVQAKLIAFTEEIKKTGIPKLAEFLGLILDTEVTTSTNILGYAYDHTRIRKLDNLRHDFAHFRKKGYSPVEAEQDAEYLMKSCFHFLNLTIKRYNLQGMDRP